MSEAKPACGSCQHWVPPMQRDDFRTSVSMSYSPGDDLDAREAEQAAVDQSMGECRGVPDNPDHRGLPSPAACVVDGSDYFAQLYTASDFYCALWSPSEGEQR